MQASPSTADSGAPPTAVIYTHSLLAPSMTFIRSHAEALRTHRAVYAGAHRVAGLALPPGSTVCVNNGGFGGAISEALFRQVNFAPSFIGALRERSPVLVHAHFGDCGPEGLAIGRSLAVPVIVTFHGRDATVGDDEFRKSWRGRAYLRRRKHLIANADIVIAVSEYIRSKLAAQGFDERRLVTHYNGIDVAGFVPEPLPREKIILFVGRFVEKKGCRFLLEAMARLKQAGVASRAVLVGDGPLRSVLEAFAREQGLDAEFVGMQPLDKVTDWMNWSAVVAVPSVTAEDGDSEGLPTVILEAQAMATPVVATRHSGNAEGVREGETALLVPERDSVSLAEALRTILSAPERARAMGAAGRDFVVAHFSLEKQVAGLEELYLRARTDRHHVVGEVRK